VDEARSNHSFYFILLAPVACLIIGALLIDYTNTPWQFVADGVLTSIIWGIVLGVTTFGGVIILTRLPVSRSLREVCRQLIPIFEGMSFWQITILSLMAGIGEELLFRGFLQQWLSGYYTCEIAIGIAAVVFGLLHFATFSYFLLTTVLGAVFGITYYLTGSLLLIMIWHGIYDLLVFWVLIRRPDLLGIK
jgi:membrane protease YdiL (CAAX protease family)